MGRKYTSGKHAIAECDRCGFQYKLKELKKLTIKTTNTEIKVCKECWEPDHPQNMQGMYPVDDPQAVQDPRPDKNLEQQRDYQYGWNPVGLNNPLAIPNIEDDLEGTGGVGTVTVTITQEYNMNKDRKGAKVTYKQPETYSQDLSCCGYPEKDVKTEGVVTRGNGAATKGTKARGPMA